MRNFFRPLALAVLVVGLLAGCLAGPSPAVQPQGAVPDALPLTITLLHVNDTHAKLEPSQTRLTVSMGEGSDRKPVYFDLGGFPSLWAAVKAERAAHPNTLFLDAGDVFQGTLYFTQFKGMADLDFLNAMGLNAMCLGNHEFDKGPALLGKFIAGASFPVLSANIDVSREPALSGSKLAPYTIIPVGGARVAVIGLTTPETPDISSPGPTVSFTNPAAAVRRYVRDLEGQGVDKIIVLSHLGYRDELALASAVNGIDVIVGGHSHTLLGPFGGLGLYSSGDYPTAARSPSGDTVLVVTSWEWEKVLGELTVSFDREGKITSWSGQPRLLTGDSRILIYDLPGADGKPTRVQFTKETGGSLIIREYDGKAYSIVPDAEREAAHRRVYDALAAMCRADPRFLMIEPEPEGLDKLAGYSQGVAELKAKVVAEAAEELKRLNDQGPGPLIAEAMLVKTGARIAVMNPGGVRTNVNPGTITVAQVYELQPFGNTLVTVDLKGSDVRAVLEDMSDFCITSYGKKPGTAYIYVAGARFTLRVNAEHGERVTDVEVKSASGGYEPLDPEATYKVVVNSFMAAGGDRNTTLKAASGKYDTGFIDSEASLEYLSGKTLTNRAEERVREVF
jgi:5'-nucleotidase